MQDAFAGALHKAFWVAMGIALLGLVCTLMMPRGRATDIRDAARAEAKLDSLQPDGETFAVTRTEPNGGPPRPSSPMPEPAAASRGT